MHLSLALTLLLSAADGHARLAEALALEARGDDTAALRSVLALVRDDPASALARLEAGRLRLKRGDDLDAAELDLDAARALAPENPRTHYYWALLQEERGRGEAALQALDVALQLRSDYSDALFRRAGLRFGHGDMAGASQDYRAYLAQHPQATGARLQLATALEREGDLPGAENVLRPLLTHPQLREVAGRRVLVLLRQQGKTAAATVLEKKLAKGDRQPKKMRPLPKSRR